MLWGEGFMSPGGVTEVRRLVGERSISGCEVLDVGIGAVLAAPAGLSPTRRPLQAQPIPTTPGPV
jgi:hypothetical protein